MNNSFFIILPQSYYRSRIAGNILILERSKLYKDNATMSNSDYIVDASIDDIISKFTNSQLNSLYRNCIDELLLVEVYFSTSNSINILKYWEFSNLYVTVVKEHKLKNLLSIS